jgi:hypothetical protein
MKDADVLQKLASIGFDPVVKNLAETTESFKTDIEDWGKMVRAAGIIAN